MDKRFPEFVNEIMPETAIDIHWETFELGGYFQVGSRF